MWIHEKTDVLGRRYAASPNFFGKCMCSCHFGEDGTCLRCREGEGGCRFCEHCGVPVRKPNYLEHTTGCRFLMALEKELRSFDDSAADSA